jgi:serine phosphatase RsbU (regulator of sigma subunit)
VAGVIASIWLVRLVIAIGSDFVPRADEIAMDWKVLAFALAMAVLTSLLSSVAPLWQAMRTTPIDVLNAGVRATAGARIRKLSQALVIAEIALAFTLLGVSAALIVHLRNLARTSPGFDPDHLLTFSVTIADSAASDDARRTVYQKRLVDAVHAIPGVVDVGFGNHVPMDGCCLSATISAEGRPVEAKAVERTSFVIVDSGFFTAARMPLVRGRFLADTDTSEDPLHVVINQSAAARYWPGENPIDRFGRFGGANGSRFQIVGVAGDIRNDGLGNPTVPEIYISNTVATANPMRFLLRSPLPPETLVPEIRNAVRQVDSALPIHHVVTMNDIISGSMSLQRVASLMTTFFALAALLMATLGVFGLVSYTVRQRTVEIGTRMALGAVGRDVLSLVLGGGLKMTAAGIVFGGIAIAASVSLLARFFDLHDIGWVPFATSTLMVTIVASVASSFPAWRASRLSPMVAIRDQPQSAWQTARSSLRKALSGLSHVMTSASEAPAVSESALLADFVAATRRAESPREQLQIALATLRDRLGADSVLLMEKAPSGEYRCSESTPIAPPDGCTLPGDGFLARRLASYRGPLPLTEGDLETLTRWADEARPERRTEVDTLKAVGARLAAALRTKNEILGMLVLGPASNRTEYDASETSVLNACAAQFALMVENSRLTSRLIDQERLRRDLALAAEVQKRLLPDAPPPLATAALAGISLPARSIGGDYFDFIDVGNKRIGIALADVAGKGVAAALIMSSLQASLRILSSDGDLSLPQLAAKMNRFLHQSTNANSYATFFYAQIDESGRRLRYVNAGHLPPYLLRSASSIQELATGGAVIGLFPQMTYEEGTVDLQPGDVLVAFTDGVTEAMNASDEEFGEERLKEILRQVVHLPVNEIAAGISQALKSWIKDAAQYDDLTFVVMKVS